MTNLGLLYGTILYPFSFFWRYDHGQSTPFRGGACLYDRHVGKVLGELLKCIKTEVLVNNFSTPKPEGQFDLVPFLEKRTDMAFLHIEIVDIGLRPELDLLDLDEALLFPGLLRPFALFILELAVIHDPADRRLCLGRDLHEIQPLFLGLKERLPRRHDPKLFPILADEPDLWGVNLPIHPNFQFLCDITPPWLRTGPSGRPPSLSH